MGSYKGRTPVIGNKVKVYVNLHMEGKFSVVDFKTNLVVYHAESVLINDAKYHVNETCRDKIRKTKRKEVHAWVTGKLVGVDIEKPEEYQEEINYDPYKYNYFTGRKGTEVKHTETAFFQHKRVYVSNLG